jgi:uncharacterized protein (DUF1501 family)
MKKPTSIDRRAFVTQASCGAAAVVSLGGIAPQFLMQAAAAEADANERVLVVIQLSGGNDGLNTIVPYTNEAYYKLRPTLAIPKNQVLKTDKQLGFNPVARGLANLLEDGRLAVVQGVGYENPNRSHFESMDIWHSCDRKQDRRPDGWLGRFVDGDRGSTDAGAMHLGAEKQPLALHALKSHAVSVRSLDQFRLQTGDANLRQTVESLAQATRNNDDLLGFVQLNTTTALAASSRVEQATRNYKPQADYPDSRLAKKLRTVAQLIEAGLGTRVYYVELTGFDTHSQQAPAHTALLRELAGALQAFVEDIQAHGHGDRVLTMCFSEFGRRVAENASQGTDHGVAAPMFLAGEMVRAGLLGKHPSLTDLDQGDLKHAIDFRSVYADVLQNWFGVKSSSILGGTFKPFGCLA